MSYMITDFSKEAVAARNKMNSLKAMGARRGYGSINSGSSNATPQSVLADQRMKANNAKFYNSLKSGDNVSVNPALSGGGSLSYGGTTADNMKASWQKAYDEAKAANKNRENELRQKYKDRYSSVMSGLEGMGDQARKDILEQGQRREGEASQNAISRGLSMGTIADSLQNSVREGTDRSIGQLNESIRNTKLGYESGLRKDEADFIERITDQYPDQRLYANMFQQNGQGQAGIGASQNSLTGGGLSGMSHSYYQGRDPVTGQIMTSPLPTGRFAGNLHQFSIVDRKKSSKPKTTTKQTTTPKIKPKYGPALPPNYSPTSTTTRNYSEPSYISDIPSQYLPTASWYPA